MFVHPILRRRNGLLMRKFTETLQTLLHDAIQISGVLFRLMIPVIVIVKILKELGAIEPLGRFLGPVMEAVGLPGTLGIVWASALVTNLYGGILAYLAVAPTYRSPRSLQDECSGRHDSDCAHLPGSNCGWPNDPEFGRSPFGIRFGGGTPLWLDSEHGLPDGGMASGARACVLAGRARRTDPARMDRTGSGAPRFHLCGNLLAAQPVTAPAVSGSDQSGRAPSPSTPASTGYRARGHRSDRDRDDTGDWVWRGADYPRGGIRPSDPARHFLRLALWG